MDRKKKGQKKHTYEDLLKYMKMIEQGYSIYHIHKEYGIKDNQLRTLLAKYQEKGPNGLLKRTNLYVDLELKMQIIEEIEKNHLTLHEVSIKYGPSTSSIERWLYDYRRDGIQALQIKKRGRPKGMGRPKKNSSSLTEFEKLQKENQELKTEIALLKKMKALVEKKKARLRKTGQWSSKD